MMAFSPGASTGTNHIFFVKKYPFLTQELGLCRLMGDSAVVVNLNSNVRSCRGWSLDAREAGLLGCIYPDGT